MPVYISTSCLADGRDLFKVLDIYAGIGLSRVELGAVHAHIRDSQLKRLKQYPFQYLCHNYFPPPEKDLVINLSSQNPATRQRCKEQLKRSIDFCAEMGIDLFTFHSGFRVELEGGLKYHSGMDIIPYEQAFMTFAEALAEINQYGLKNGVRIGIENHMVAQKDVQEGQNPYSILYRAEEFERLWALLPSPNLGMLLDLGHLKTSACSLDFDKHDFIEKVKDRIIAFHVHDNSGQDDEHKVVEKDAWFSKILCKSRFNTLPLILESGKLEAGQILQQQKLMEGWRL
jgi:sugar phosphate isomerase/epimerase